MPLVLTAKNNPNYGGTLINQKYSPLQDITIDKEDRVLYQALFTNRLKKLGEVDAYPPNALELYGNLPAADPRITPMVVVSSNRANWLQHALDNAVVHDGDFTGYLDPSTFRSWNGQMPVAWFSPRRSGRPVYIVVHWSEYDYYYERIGNRYQDVMVVGYKFVAKPPALDMVGFGASRYAALQLMMTLGYDKAWAVDDNVINVNGFPNTLAEVEALMTEDIWGLGFGAATTNIAYVTSNYVKLQDNQPKLDGAEPGLLQQVVLWNLARLRGANINYSPLLVTSNEDVSLSNYLRIQKYDHRILKTCSIVKFLPEQDPTQADDDPNRGASVEIPNRRNRLMMLFNDIEAQTLIHAGNGQVTLQAFISGTVLPAANQPSGALYVTQSRAIEQVLSAAILRGCCPGDPNPFNPYGGPANVVMKGPEEL